MPDTTLLSPDDLSTRWGIPTTTLAGWRYRGSGPAYLKLMGHVRYRATDVEAYERDNVHGVSAE